MLCPVCDIAMFVLEFDLVEIDYCPECHGVWLDTGELELIGERAGALCAELEAAIMTGGREPETNRRDCPVCSKGLVESTTDTEPPIVLDCCTYGHGIWFDAGELPAVVQAAGAQEDNVLARFFAELCGVG